MPHRTIGRKTSHLLMKVLNDKGRYRQLVSGYRKRLLTRRFRHLDFAEIPAPTDKEISVKPFLTLTSFIIHYPDRRIIDDRKKHADASEFCELGDGVL